jgi:hypothetical protein
MNPLKIRKAAQARAHDPEFVQECWLEWLDAVCSLPQEEEERERILVEEGALYGWFWMDSLAEFAILIDPAKITEFVCQHEAKSGRISAFDVVLQHHGLPPIHEIVGKLNIELTHAIAVDWLSRESLYRMFGFIKLHNVTRGKWRLGMEAIQWAMNHLTHKSEVQILSRLVDSTYMTFADRVQHLISVGLTGRIVSLHTHMPWVPEFKAYKAMVEIHEA